MHPDTRLIAARMKEFGLTLLGRALHDATFSEMTAPYSHAVSVILAAQAAEILIKARIAEEHPLLIFKGLPLSSTTSDTLTLDELFEYGQSHPYEKLPELLWATTGIRIGELNLFRDFGRLRNAIMHFSVPNAEMGVRTLAFVTQFLLPLVHQFWEINALSYVEEWYEDIVSEGHLEYALISNSIPISDRLRETLGADSNEEASKTYEASLDFKRS